GSDRASNERLRTAKNLTQLALATHSYHDAYGHFPAPAIYDGQGSATGGMMGGMSAPGGMGGTMGGQGSAPAGGGTAPGRPNDKAPSMGVGGPRDRAIGMGGGGGEGGPMGGGIGLARPQFHGKA